MKSYRTSFLRVAALMALLCSFSFVPSQKASASCSYFSIGTADSVWSFTADAGGHETRYLTIKNNTDTILTLDFIRGGAGFAISDSLITLYAHDTTTLAITFEPSSTAQKGTVTGYLRIAKYGTDCRQYLGLSGTVTGANSGGHDKNVTIDPSSVALGPVAPGADTCQPFTLVNYTGASVTITSMTFINGSGFSLAHAFNGATIDSGGSYRFYVCFKGDANQTRVSDSLQVLCQYGGATHTLFAWLRGYTSTTTNTGDLLVADPHEINFGAIPADSTACRSIIVKNMSTVPVKVTYWYQCNNTSFSVTPGFKDTTEIAVGGSMTFEVCFTPTVQDSGVSCYLHLGYYAMDPNYDGKTLVVNFYGEKAGGNPTNTVCLRSEQGSNYQDAVVVGGSANHTLHLINASANDITLNTFDIYGPDAKVFSIDSKQFPITVPANSTSTTITYTFSPTSARNDSTGFYARAAFSLSGNHLACDSAYAYLVGFVVHSSINTTDTVVRPIFPADPRTLGLEGNGATVSTTFYFTNNLNVDCTVNKIYLATGKYFTIASTNPSPTPFVLHPGANLTVVITYTATDNHVHHDSLMIDANHNLQAQGFELQGVQLGAASVASLPEGVAINVSPNPTSNYLTVDMAGVSSADIQVYDLLGKNIASAKASTTWKWNASNIIAGSYIVRIAGQSASGEVFVASKRVIVSK